MEEQIKKGVKQQPDASLNQANPVSGTKYTVLDTIRNVRIIGIEVNVTWTVQPSPLEIHITIDGQTLRFFKTDPVSATAYFCKNSWGALENAQELTGKGENLLLVPADVIVELCLQIIEGRISREGLISKLEDTRGILQRKDIELPG